MKNISLTIPFNRKVFGIFFKNQVLSKEALKALTQIIQKTEEKDSISNIKLYPIGRIEVEEGNFQLVLSSKYKDSLKVWKASPISKEFGGLTAATMKSITIS